MEKHSSTSILVSAGGTGGDLFPAIAIVEELQKQFPMDKPIQLYLSRIEIEG